MKIGSKGFSTRFDDDLGGNHIERIRSQSNGLGVFLDMKNRLCTLCGEKKPKKGGTSPSKGPWSCFDCKTKKVSA